MRILIADDHPIFRAGLKESLLKDSAIEFVGEADSGHKVLDLARKQRWDAVILDITMPGKDGLEVLQELRRERPKLPVLILSAHPEDQLALRLLAAGAAGYVTKDKAPAVLLTALRKISQGGKYIGEATAEKLVFRLASETTIFVSLITGTRRRKVVKFGRTDLRSRLFLLALVNHTSKTVVTFP